MDAEVIFDYDKTQEDELTLRVGTVIHDVKEVDEGWCEGELNGIRGMFPDNFVHLIPAAVAAHIPLHSSEPPRNNVSLRNTDPLNKIRRAKVTFSYTADSTDELSLQPGQVIEIIEEEEEGWWRGKMGSKQGVFPSNFVEEIFEEERKPGSQRASSPEPPTSQMPVMDSQTAPLSGEPEAKSGVRVGKGMPAFDPSKARALLKPSSKTNLAPPLEKPPEHKKPAGHSHPVKPPAPARQLAKVTFDYDADNSDELTIKIGEMVDIIDKQPVGQEGWWEVTLRGKVGLIPDNFVELLSTPEAVEPSLPQPKLPPISKEPPSKQMVLPPAQKKLVGDGKKPPLVPTKAEPADMDQTDFPVPKTTPLDTSAIKDRPKHKNRPPTNRNAHHANHEEDAVEESALSEDSGKNLPPWKAELMAKKKQPKPAKLAPKPGNKPKPAVAIAKPDMSPVARSRLNTGGSSTSSKTEFNPPPMTTLPKTTVATPASTSSATGPNKALPPITKPTAATPLALVLNKTISPVAKPATTPVEIPTKATFLPLSKPAGSVGKPHKPVETKPPHTASPTTSLPPPSTHSSSTTTHSSSTTNDGLPPLSTPAPIVPSLPNNAWKEAFDKLREDFIKFKAQMLEKIDILTDDLDRERKNRASLEIDIDRLKKAQRSLVN